MWDVITTILMVDLIDRLPKRLRIGCWVLVGLAVFVLLFAVLLSR
jgi:hypothetical protein